MNVYKRIALILMTGATLLLFTSLLSSVQAPRAPSAKAPASVNSTRK